MIKATTPDQKEGKKKGLKERPRMLICDINFLLHFLFPPFSRSYLPLSTIHPLFLKGSLLFSHSPLPFHFRLNTYLPPHPHHHTHLIRSYVLKSKIRQLQQVYTQECNPPDFSRSIPSRSPYPNPILPVFLPFTNPSSQRAQV